MEISFDMKADALYIKFQEGKFAKNKRIDEDTIIDLDSKGRLLGRSAQYYKEGFYKRFIWS